METFTALWGSPLLLANIVLHIGVPIYLYNRAKEDGLRQPAWWILFGIFEPVVALMLYYLIRFLRGELRKVTRAE